MLKRRCGESPAAFFAPEMGNGLSYCKKSYTISRLGIDEWSLVESCEVLRFAILSKSDYLTECHRCHSVVPRVRGLLHSALIFCKLIPIIRPFRSRSMVLLKWLRWGRLYIDNLFSKR
ncbi:hypothetical protein [Rubritalea tangerina]|uniref:hypothetical protein n=1 Tax=Rubritalea tangerina TaxID=430798 RepID=UPI0036202FAE